MLNRSTNLLVLFTIAMALIVLATNIVSAWRYTLPWEQGWVAKADGTPKYKAEELLIALQNANAAEDYSAVHDLNEALESEYKPSGDIHVRFTIREISEAFAYSGGTLLFLTIPMSLNYIRNGSFQLWNRAL